MIPLALSEISTILNGELVLPAGVDDSLVISGVSETDSRLIEPGGIFFAKPGEETDGHLFIPQAIERGAALLVVDRAVTASVPHIIVPDTVEALADLAREVVSRVRSRGHLKIIGITGSNGKTTTKNLVAALCAEHGETVWPKASFNNEVGAPLTMLKVTFDTKFLVLELGASGIGHIARLTRIAPLDIAVALMVGLAHAGEFGGIENTIIAKTEIIRGLVPGGVSILNRDDPRVRSMAEVAPGPIRWFGLSEGCDYRASRISTSLSGTSFTLEIDGESRLVQFKVLGEHHVMNALAAIAVATELGFPLDGVLAKLSEVSRAERWRMEVLTGNEFTVINDAYNASPDSMAAALKTLVQVAPAGSRTIAVLGEMAELGEFSGEEHDRIALLIVRLNVDTLVVVGEGARRLHISAINEGSWDGESVYFASSDEAYDYVVSHVAPGDVILVKSSNSANLRFLGDRLGEVSV